MSYEPWPALDRRMRIRIAAFGLVAWLAAVPASVAGLMILGFHGPLDEWDETVALIALPTLPLLLFLLGLGCFFCFSRRGLLTVKALAAASALDLLLLVASFHSMNRPEPKVVRPLPAPPPPRPTGAVEAAPKAVQVSFTCSAAGDECWTIGYEDGREVSRKRSAGTGSSR